MKPTPSLLLISAVALAGCDGPVVKVELSDVTATRDANNYVSVSATVTCTNGAFRCEEAGEICLRAVWTPRTYDGTDGSEDSVHEKDTPCVDQVRAGTRLTMTVVSNGPIPVGPGIVLAVHASGGRGGDSVVLDSP
jgi:hypothetical protein